MSDLVTIAIHNGKKEYCPLLENLLKSFLICNEYPNIELLLVESGGNEDVRKWLTSIDFDSNYTNFDGTTTDIVRNKDVNIAKKLLFKNFDPEVHWSFCYMNSMLLT